MPNHKPAPALLRDTLRVLHLPFNRWRAMGRQREYHARPHSLEKVVNWAMHFNDKALMKVQTLQVPWEITHLTRAAQAPLFTHFPPPSSRSKVTLLSSNSHESAFKQRVAAALAGHKADFLFIDGDHTVEGVTADYEDYREFVRPGGLIAFHDIVEKQPLPTNQVAQFWQRIKHETETTEFIHNQQQCGFGIGLIRVPVL